MTEGKTGTTVDERRLVVLGLAVHINDLSHVLASSARSEPDRSFNDEVLGRMLGMLMAKLAIALFSAGQQCSIAENNLVASLMSGVNEVLLHTTAGNDPINPPQSTTKH